MPEAKLDTKIGTLNFDGDVAFGGVVVRVKNDGEERDIIEKVFNTSMKEWDTHWDKHSKKVEFIDGQPWLQITFMPR